MLNITRSVGKNIHIGDDIVISIVSLENGKVDIGISAPEDVKILPQEVFERIQTLKDKKLT